MKFLKVPTIFVACRLRNNSAKKKKTSVQYKDHEAIFFIVYIIKKLFLYANLMKYSAVNNLILPYLQ